MKPTVSVIIPVRDRENLIIRCLDSVLHQTESPKELIVVDNASTDSTPIIVKQWFEKNNNKGITFKFIYEKIPGACNARQAGNINAKGEYLIFFDSDDEMNPNLISKALKAIEKNPSIDIVCWKARIHLLDGSYKIPPFLPDKPIEGHLIHTLFRPQGYIIRKEFLDKANGWSKPIKVWNDFELGLRLLMQNPLIHGIPEILAEINAQENSITGKDFSSKEGQWEETLNEMEKETESSEYSQKHLILNIINYRRAILAAQYHREGNTTGASRLMKETIRNKSFKDKFLLKFAFFYTKTGFRGAWRIIRYAF